jgi:nicotinate phosphoribosyltransferase
MAQTDFKEGRHELQASKTYFYRKAPFGGSYAIFGGLSVVLNQIRDFAYTDIPVRYGYAIEALKDQGYDEDFLKYLKYNPKPKMKVYAPPEGSIILPNEPVAIVEGNLISVRIAEGMFRELNFGSLSMTKWQRVCQAASPGATFEFSRRRAQNSIGTSIYAHLAGCAVSSNTEIRKGLDVKIEGTMGHEWIQSYGDELEAFMKWVEHNPERPTLLVDTIDTLKSGIPNAIKTFTLFGDAIRAAGGTPGVRFDSGDLAYLAIETVQMFTNAGIEEYKLFMTNDLDEYAIEEIKGQIFTYAPKAGLSPEEILKRMVWAAGTKPGTCYDQPSFGGVAKLGSVEKRGVMKSVIKIAKDNPIKTSIPGNNRSAYVWNGNELVCCLTYGKDEDLHSLRYACHPDDRSKRIDLGQYKGLTFDLRQTCVYDSSSYVVYDPTTDEVRKRVADETGALHWTLKRLSNPHKIKVSLSEKVFDLRQKMINNFELIEE